MQETEDIVKRLRDWCMNVRRKPSPLSDAIPMAQEAADTIATLRAEVEVLRADAERWRTARKLARYYPDPEGGDYVAFDRLDWPRTCHATTAEYADAAIDAAKADKEGAKA